jgi:hypothetical protein
MWIIGLYKIQERTSEETLSLHNNDQLMLLKVQSHVVKNNIGAPNLKLHENI